MSASSWPWLLTALADQIPRPLSAVQVPALVDRPQDAEAKRGAEADSHQAGARDAIKRPEAQGQHVVSHQQHRAEKECAGEHPQHEPIDGRFEAAVVEVDVEAS